MNLIHDVVIQKHPGGFLVQLDGSTQIVTSLTKVLKLIRDFLSEEDAQETPEA